MKLLNQTNVINRKVTDETGKKMHNFAILVTFKLLLEDERLVTIISCWSTTSRSSSTVR